MRRTGSLNHTRTEIDRLISPATGIQYSSHVASRTGAAPKIASALVALKTKLSAKIPQLSESEMLGRWLLICPLSTITIIHSAKFCPQESFMETTRLNKTIERGFVYNRSPENSRALSGLQTPSCNSTYANETMIHTFFFPSVLANFFHKMLIDSFLRLRCDVQVFGRDRLSVIIQMMSAFGKGRIKYCSSHPFPTILAKIRQCDVKF